MKQVLLILLLFPALVYSQVNQDGTSFLYKKDFQYGFAIHTQGFAITTKYTKNKNYFTKKQYDFDWVLSMRHATEATTPGNDPQNDRPFVFGKLNEMSVLRALYGRQKIIADFHNTISVRVNFHYGLGLNLALLKPVYLNVFKNNGTFETEQKRFEPEKYTNPAMISGSASKYLGINEMSFKPGISSKIALSFEWGRQDDKFKSLEVGCMADIFTEEIPIMAFTKNKQFYINLYAAFSFGNRW